MITHETYVNLDIAKLLKRAGFNWPCEHCYCDIHFDEEYYEPADFNKDCLYQISAPTVDVACEWVRQKLGYHINTSVRKVGGDKGVNKYIYYIDSLCGYQTIDNELPSEKTEYDNPYGAIQAGLYKCITEKLKN